ncbi:MetQ/NlpA family ABC transporter substrate-binding protein [Lactococcus allomyrinae]|uniref:Lipoprotein n=1 Tax=Lactococcus allomyrinae TaxID=2419773 RepID=A0A387B9F2_9LACT|nr:MetQ/NlpA family ABC transporter substrate-binding protein [Lactococcus allomyrinae]AYG00343.1 MetQ/NlpA family ABC transporter substrate-binding protein [Lactococcus allomyrinae]
MNPRRRNLFFALLLLIVISLIGGLSWKNHNKKVSASSHQKVVIIGRIAGTKKDDAIWEVVTKQAKEKYGISLKYKFFTDYSQPNVALSNGSIDLDAFQIYAFLDNWNKAHHSKLVSIGDLWITPLHLFSEKVKSVSDLQDGATIAVPNDTSNESHALHLLEVAGLIKLNVSDSALATIQNISDNPRHLKIKELDAAQTAHALGSIDAAVITRNFADTAKIPLSEAIFSEPLKNYSKQWVSLVAANKKYEHNKTYEDVIKALHSPEVATAVKKNYSNGELLPAWKFKTAN